MKYYIVLSILFCLFMPSLLCESGFTWGVWYNSYQEGYVTFQEKYDKEMFARHLAIFKEMGINRIYFLVKFPTGHVFYNSKIAPRHPKLDWDPFDFIVKECRRLNMEIYPYINLMAEGEYNEKTKQEDMIGPYLEKYPQYAMTDPDGKQYGWVCPSIEEIIQYQLSLVKEVITNYSVDGIQLDRIRYPNGRTCYNASCIQLYEKIYNKKPAEDDYDWTYFRQELLTRWVKRVREVVHSVDPKLKLSAAVFPRPYATAENQFQAWPRWCRNNLLEEVVPMSYYRNGELFQQYLKQELEVTPPYVPLLAGIGTFLIKDSQIVQGQVDFAKVVQDQISFAMDRGVQGVVFFNGYHILSEPLATVVKKFAQPQH